MDNKLPKLLATYSDNRSAYDHNETETRSGLIDPLLELLGWDVTDPRQVRREQSVDTAAGKKRTDYILYDDRGRPVVVIEAKKPNVNIEHDNDAVFQVLRYGWNLETVPVGILTNFTNWEVYKTSTRPDKQNTQRFRVPDLCFSSEEYIEQWEKIESYFSRQAVLRGRLRAYATTAKLSLPPDEAFLKDLERYRELIAKALVGNESLRHNWDLSEYSQRVLDRLLLIRILEDRGYGERGGWLHRIAQATDPGQQLSDHVAALEPTFNSRFFKWHEVDSLHLEPEKLRKVVKELADPDSVYNFAAMPVEIIGKAYEKFLGSTVRITPARRVKIEAKPEVRKAGGVYYTPGYIVDYIVENTLGPLFADKTESTVSKYKVLDPACGSGSFLIGAARWLDTWYQQKYGRKLTYQERRTTVLRHLHGVDIDQNAVEVTQLSLCLWLLEEAPHQMEMAHEALLPDLSANIKCGNSLIGSDFYTQDQGDLFADDEVRHRVNAFDWGGPKGFAEIMKKGGFDAVIGNPPYVRQELFGGQKEYFSSHYDAYVATADLYVLFIEKALRLLGNKGRFSYIVSNKWMRAQYGEKLRRYVKQYQIEQLIDFGDLPVFGNISAYPVVLVMSKEGAKKPPLYAPVKQLDFSSLSAEVKDIAYELEAGTMSDAGFTLVRSEEQAIIEKMKKAGVPLEKYSNSKIKYGIKTGFNKAFIIDKARRDELIAEDPKSAEIIKPFVVGRNVRRFGIEHKGNYLILTKIGVAIKEYPAIFNHLKQYESQLKKRWDKGNHWWELRACAYYADFEKPKIIFPDIARNSRFAYCDEPLWFNNTCYFLPSDDLYLLGILNSRLLFLYLSRISTILRGKWYRYWTRNTSKLPIRTIDQSNPDDVARHDDIVKLVEQMLKLHKELPTTTGNDKAQYEQLIAATDKRIDQLVYQLYDLTDEEIAIVEEAVQR